MAKKTYSMTGKGSVRVDGVLHADRKADIEAEPKVVQNLVDSGYLVEKGADPEADKKAAEDATAAEKQAADEKAAAEKKAADDKAKK